MRVGWRRLSTESAGVGDKRLWLTDLRPPVLRQKVRLVSQVKESIRARNKIKIVSSRSLRLYCQIKSHFSDCGLSKISRFEQKVSGT